MAKDRADTAFSLTQAVRLPPVVPV
jgi:hypothetical protein